MDFTEREADSLTDIFIPLGSLIIATSLSPPRSPSASLPLQQQVITGSPFHLLFSGTLGDDSTHHNPGVGEEKLKSRSSANNTAKNQ